MYVSSYVEEEFSGYSINCCNQCILFITLTAYLGMRG